ncbi:MAG TPA: hypothetical protein VGH65_08005 [Verrucomicrobiaceae bacterium]
MKKLPTRQEAEEMRFSSLSCRIDEWIKSRSAAFSTSNSFRMQCEKVIDQLEAKIATEGSEPDDSKNKDRLRIVQKLRRDVKALP